MARLTYAPIVVSHDAPPPVSARTIPTTTPRSVPPMVAQLVAHGIPPQVARATMAVRLLAAETLLLLQGTTPDRRAEIGAQLVPPRGPYGVHGGLLRHELGLALQRDNRTGLPAVATVLARAVPELEPELVASSSPFARGALVDAFDVLLGVAVDCCAL